jgi:hypothetical protein
MNSFAMGRYIPYHSFLHKMDPRAKIFCLIVLMVAVFMPLCLTWQMVAVMAGIAFLLITVLLLASHHSILQLLSSLKSLWIMIIFLLIIYILTPRSNHSLPVAFVAWNYAVYWDSFAEAGTILIRLMLMIELSLILTATTKPLDLTFALEWYLTPAQVDRFPLARGGDDHYVGPPLHSDDSRRREPDHESPILARRRFRTWQTRREIPGDYFFDRSAFRLLVHPKRRTRQRDGMPRL